MSVGLYLSRCRGRVDSVVDLDAIAAEASKHAAVVRIVDDLFDADVQQRMERDISSAELTSVVLAGNSPDHYRRSLSAGHLKGLLTRAGINPNRIVVANLLEQVALAHGDDHPGAQRKASATVRLALAEAEARESAEVERTSPRQSVLVLGATIEGLVAAQRLLQLGYGVHIADRGEGGARLASDHSLNATRAFVTGHRNSEVIDHASIADGMGWVGDYEIMLGTPEGLNTVRVGGMVIADPSDTAWIDELRGHFRVDVDDDGRARSIDPATHPSETVDPGIMVVPPAAEGGRDLREQVAAADSAAMALLLKLSRPELIHYSDTSQVDPELCGGCASCVKTCAFGACSIDPDTKLSHVDIRRCQGCGKCVVSCPVGARDIISSPHDHLLDSIKTLADVETDGAKVLGFLCGGCGYPAADSAGELASRGGLTYPAGFLPVRIPCGGRLDTLYVLEAFKAGFDGVTVFRCREGHCHNLIGNLDMDRRMNLLRTVLRSRGLDDSRLRIVDISPMQGEAFAEAVNTLFTTVSSLHDAKEVAS